MKKTLGTLLICAGFLGLTGCVKSNNILEPDVYENTFNPYLDEQLVKHYNQIETLDTTYAVEVVAKNGETYAAYWKGFEGQKLVALQNACAITLRESDVRNITKGFRDRLIFPEYEIIKTEKLNQINKCISNYLNTTVISNDEIDYFIADKRIKANFDYQPLKLSVSEAVQDESITYTEFFSIYKTLDKAISQKRVNALKDLGRGVGGEHLMEIKKVDDEFVEIYGSGIKIK